MNKTVKYGFNLPAKGVKDWHVYLNANFNIAEKEIETLAQLLATLNTRTNNIVAQAGTDNTEIVDARTGADSTVRQTLGTLIREIHEQQFKHPLYGVFDAKDYKEGTAEETADDRAYSGTVVSAVPSGNSTPWDVVVVERDKFVHGNFTASIRLKTTDNTTESTTIINVYLEQYNDDLETPAYEEIAKREIKATEFIDTDNYQVFYIGGGYTAGSKLRVRIESTDFKEFTIDNMTIIAASQSVI